ncbi:Transport and Golgi organization 2-like protein, partial [Bienertia sinuspersici]
AQRLLSNFKEVMDSYGDGEVHPHEMVEKLMIDTAKADESSLPGILPVYLEHQLSSIFISTDTPLGRYGTRSTSVVLVKADGEVCFHERYLEEDCWKEHVMTYQIE